jgi:hypothetical protein
MVAAGGCVLCLSFHERMLEQNQLELGQVQADEIKAKTQKGSMWMAIMVSTRLWLGGAVNANRDTDLLQQVANQVRRIALCCPILIAVDGLNTYLTVFRDAFRTGIPRLAGQTGRMTLVQWPNIAIVQVIKSKQVGVLNIKRVNATFRQRLACLFRRTRFLAHHCTTLQTSMYVLDYVYNFCDFHKSLRVRLSVGWHGFRWVQRTPALAAHLTDHRWSLEELFITKTLPPPWIKKQGRGRLPNRLLFRMSRYGI